MSSLVTLSYLPGIQSQLTHAQREAIEKKKAAALAKKAAAASQRRELLQRTEKNHVSRCNAGVETPVITAAQHAAIAEKRERALRLLEIKKAKRKMVEGLFSPPGKDMVQCAVW